MTHIKPTFNIPASLEDRLIHAQRMLTLIHAAAAVDPDAVPCDAGELLDAISAAADEAAITLFPLRFGPADVLNWAPKEPEHAPRRATKRGNAL
jgi:hypothetical protein